jgi:hypothetical protein
MRDFTYKLGLYLNIIKYQVRNYFKPNSNNENIIFLENYFKDKKNGFYIDVGCFHPIRLSNTMFLYSKGWSGMNIDINKKSIDLFKISRPRDINLNFGVGSKNEFKSFFIIRIFFNQILLIIILREIF